MQDNPDHANDEQFSLSNPSWPYPVPTSHLESWADEGEASPRRRNPRKAVAGKNPTANISSSKRLLEELNSNEEYVVRAALKCSKNRHTVSPPSHTAIISKDGVLLGIVEINIDYDREEWKRYSKTPTNSAGESSGKNEKLLHCTVQMMDNAHVVECPYQGKRMRRHYESCHLRIRPFKCTWCSHTFMQRSNGQQHLIIHTRQLPWVCYYCTDAFRDPSKRTRHIIDIHPEH